MSAGNGDKPLFSVITVTFNASSALRRTVAALQRQTYHSFEHIIVDGGSTDGTRQWLETNAINHVRWVSEPDNGLYDAMNKGLRMARGSYVWFINAGDEPYALDTMDLLSRITFGADAVYGEVMICDQQGKDLGTRSKITTQTLPECLTWRSLQQGMVVSHQGFLVRREIAPPYMEGNLCADIDWMIRCLKVSGQVVNAHAILARFETGGISTKRRRRSLIDRYNVLRLHFGFWPNLMNHLFIVFRALFLHWKKRSLPDHSSA